LRTLLENFPKGKKKNSSLSSLREKTFNDVKELLYHQRITILS